MNANFPLLCGCAAGTILLLLAACGDDLLTDIESSTAPEDSEETSERVSTESGDPSTVSSTVSVSGTSTSSGTTLSGTSTEGPAAPTNVTASTNDPDRVTLSWDAVEDAERYLVFRDGAYRGEVTEPGYVDEGAGPPTRPAVRDLEATVAGEDIELTWSEPESAAGALHLYTVRAANAVEGEASDAAEGRRAALALVDYLVAVDEEEAEETSETSWTDSEAAAPTLSDALTLSASDGTRFDAVELEAILPAPVAGEERSYSVTARWGSAEAPLEGIAATLTARRPVPAEIELVFEWQDGETWEEVAASAPLEPPYPETSTVSALDAEAPVDGTARTYRVVAMADDGEWVSETTTGARRPPLPDDAPCTEEDVCASGICDPVLEMCMPE